MDDGRIDIKAPNSGPWSGVALYQDPALTVGVDIDYAGNNPKTPVWDISGMVYMPKANVQFSGVVNKASNGNACFVMVIFNLLINGNGRSSSRPAVLPPASHRRPATTPRAELW